MNYPASAIEKFEEISYLIKKGDRSKIDDFLQCELKKDYARHCDVRKSATQSHIDKVKSFFEVKQITENEEEEAV